MIWRPPVARGRVAIWVRRVWVTTLAASVVFSWYRVVMSSGGWPWWGRVLFGAGLGLAGHVWYRLMRDAWRKPPRITKSDVPVLGWKVAEVNQQLQLAPFAAAGPPHQRDADAICAAGRRANQRTYNHRPPALGCSCGFYAMRDLGTMGLVHAGLLLLQVELSGRILSYTKGYRAEHQLIVAGWLGPCVICHSMGHLPARPASGVVEVVLRVSLTGSGAKVLRTMWPTTCENHAADFIGDDVARVGKVWTAEELSQRWGFAVHPGIPPK